MHYAIQPTASHFIDGHYVEDTSGTPIPVICQVSEKQIAIVYAATPAIIEQALAAASRAQRLGTRRFYVFGKSDY
jgi:betaine-aldehyde dehydrogenase